MKRHSPATHPIPPPRSALFPSKEEPGLSQGVAPIGGWGKDGIQSPCRRWDATLLGFPGVMSGPWAIPMREIPIKWENSFNS